jgi:crossover junction endodeoxyribonuclease RuvC
MCGFFMKTEPKGMNNITVIGIDPGSTVTGWGVVREVSGVLSLVDCGAIRPKGDEFSGRLASIYHALCDILERYAPEEAAVEQVFSANNAATALKLGQARGVAIAACAARNISVRDYEPTMVKKSLVGVGRAEKSQVAFMVGQLLGYKNPDWALDTSDALAVAICHLTMRRFQKLAAGT